MKQSYRKKYGTGSHFYYGWVIVFVSGIGFFFSGPGQTYNVSVFIDSLIRDFHWSRSLVSALYAAGSIAAGFALGFVGKLIDRFGHRKVATMLTVLLALGCLLMGFVSNLYMLFLGFFLIRLLGQGSMSVWPATLVPKWFHQKRATALSIMGLGGMMGGAAIPLISNWFIQNWGWQRGWQFWALLLFLLMAPLAWFLIRNNPRPGSAPAQPQQSKPRAKQTNHDQPDTSFSLTQARQTLAYWLLLFCLFVPAMLNTGIIFHLVSILGERGLSPTAAAATLSIMAVVGFPASLAAGYIYDRMPARTVLIAFFIFYLFTFFWLQNIQSLERSIIYGVLNGVMLGFFNVSVNIVAPNYFGLAHLGSIRGNIQTVLLIGSAFGPLPIGFAYDYLGSYTQVIWLIMIIPALAAAASCFMRPPSNKK